MILGRLFLALTAVKTKFSTCRISGYIAPTNQQVPDTLKPLCGGIEPHAWVVRESCVLLSITVSTRPPS